MKRYFIFLLFFVTIFFSTRLFAAENQTLLQSFRSAFIQLVRDVEKCAVSVEARMGVGQQKTSDPKIEMINSGAGLLLNADFIVVKQKIVYGSEQITITTHDQNVVSGSIIGTDNDLGLAFIKLEKPIDNTFPPKTLENPALIEAGEPVLILSNSLGIMPAVSFGMVNCTRNDGMIQLSADLPAGTSGGAVFNFNGELIGLVAVEIDLFPDELPYSSDLLASETVLVTPIQDVKRSMARTLVQSQKDVAYFGVSVEDWPSQLGGAHIKMVLSGSPAAVSGIKTGDIILSTDNRKVANANDLFGIISAHSAGENVTMQILRGDRIFPCTVKLGRPPQKLTRINRRLPDNGNGQSGQQKKINQEYLQKRLQKLEMEVQILKQMIEDN